MAPILHLQSRWGGKGFTLIELMIVLVCLAIIGLLVMPSADDRSTRLTSAARRLVADIEYAQAASIGRGADPCVVVFNQSDDSYHLARASDPTTPLNHPVTHQPYVIRFGAGAAGALHGVTYDTIEAGDDSTLMFTAMGALDSSVDATITLRCGDEALAVAVDADTGEPTTP